MNKRTLIATVLGLAIAAPAAAQDSTRAMHDVFVAAQPPEQGGAGLKLKVESAIESRVTTGRPYSAEATTEFVHVLGDGNRIARKSSSRIFRDGEGRTRREELGSKDTLESISIYDPVARTSFVLDPAAKTARKSVAQIVYPAWKMDDAKKVMIFSAKVAAAEEPAAAERAAEHGGAHSVTEVRTVATPAPRAGLHHEFVNVVEGNVRVERTPLGRQTIEGVAADGTKTTTIIPAGAIGNQLEIRIVSEEWFAPDLEVLVMTRHSDPRSGETTYRLSNIIRAEPGAGMFDLPPDYTVKDSNFRIEKD
ncbi:MAG: hypothetical protein ACRD1U_05725 [Vicinamibacterales bacterium]